MKCLLDTHFFIWIVTAAPRLKRYPWLQRYAPWGVSPVSFLEIQILAELGKLKLQRVELIQAVRSDPRFVLDDVSVLALVEKAAELGWTRDPFDRLLTAHSAVRRLPLCTTDAEIQAHHNLIVPDVA